MDPKFLTIILILAGIVALVSGIYDLMSTPHPSDYLTPAVGVILLLIGLIEYRSTRFL